MKKLYKVELTAAQREQLEKIVHQGEANTHVITRARSLLKAAAGWNDPKIAQAFDISTRTVLRTRQRFCQGGLDLALFDKPRKGAAPKLGGTQQALVTALACSPAPPGQARWTLQLLADRLVQLGEVESIAPNTVRAVLKKNQLKPHLKEQWVLPSSVDGLFVARMENILDLYALPYDPLYPVVCFDEKGKELLLQCFEVVPMQKGQLERQDYEYKHNGACNLFVAYDVGRGWRQVEVTKQRRAEDCAHFLKGLVDGVYAQAERIRLVCDNLNIHTWSCLYKTFPPEEARRIASKVEFHYTPKHASWLNMVEIEIGVLSRQCLSRRMGEIEYVASEVAAWEAERNRRAVKIEWQFSNEKARTKLQRLYPSLETDETISTVTELLA